MMDKKKIIAIIAIIIVIIAAIAIAVVVINNNNNNTGKTVNSVDDLKGARIGVETGTTGDLYVTKNYEGKDGTQIFRYNTYSDVVQALLQGKIDCIVMDNAPASNFVNQHKELKVLNEDLPGIEKEKYGFAFNKNDAATRDAFNASLAKLKANGTLDAIIAYWGGHLDGQADPYIKDNVESNDGMKVATNPDFPPYDCLYGQAYTGIDMDIIRAVAADNGWKIKFVNTEFDGIIAGISTGAYKIGASGITITEERLESVLFSNDYVEAKQVVITKS